MKDLFFPISKKVMFRNYRSVTAENILKCYHRVYISTRLYLTKRLFMGRKESNKQIPTYTGCRLVFCQDSNLAVNIGSVFRSDCTYFTYVRLSQRRPLSKSNTFDQNFMKLGHIV